MSTGRRWGVPPSAPVAFSARPAYTLDGVTTGAPIYLVSACSSGEEFVAAFRRYADRNGVLFVPIAEPLPPGKRGRFAVALTGGGVMLEGEAEVVSSAKTPSVLYGRVGMTLKFIDPDEPSKTLLTELERARLAVKPGPPSVAPRPAGIPAEPRPKPPAPAGRVDAVNALAECVAIGDLSTLVGDEPAKGIAPKFVVPSIPPMGPGARPKNASTPPVGTPSPAATTMGMPPLKKPTTGGTPVVPPSPTATTMGMPALAKAPAAPIAPTTPTREDPTAPTPARHADIQDLNQTVKGPAPAVDLLIREREERLAREKAKADLETTMRGPPPAAPKAGTPAAGVPRPPTPASGQTVVPQRTTTPAAGSNVVGATLPKAPSGPVAVKQATPPAGVPKPPVVADPRPIVESQADDEKTDLTSVPIEPSGSIKAPQEIAKPDKGGRETRKTVIGVAVVPSGVHVLPATPARSGEQDERDTSVMAAEETSGPAVITSAPPPRAELEAAGPPSGPVTIPQPVPSAVLRAAAVEEHTPSGDWTMTVGADGPTITPVPRRAAGTRPPEDKPAKPIPPGPPTGDFIIALDPTRPDGWSEPSRIEKRPELPPDKPGPPVSTVASVKDLDSEAKPDVPKLKPDEAKIEIDPTLMEPLQPLQPIDDFDDDPPGSLPPPPSTSHPIQTPPHGLVAATPGVIATPMHPGAVPIVDQMRAAAHAAMPGSATGEMQTVPPPIDAMGATMPAMHGAYMTPAPHQGPLANASGQVPAYQHEPAYPVVEQAAYLPTEAIRVPRTPDERRKRMILIGGIAAGVVILGIILVVALSGGNGKTADSTEPPPGDGSADKQVSQPPDPKAPPPPVKTPPDKSGDGSAGSAQQASVSPPVAVDAAAEEPAPVQTPPDGAQDGSATPEVATATDCTVDVATVPAGVEVSLDKTVLGTTPFQATLPCGVESRLTFKKTRFVTATRAVTPKSEGQKPLKVALAKVTFTVKVSSSPAGATILLGTKSLGVTPAAVKLPAFETSTLTIKKDGYQPDTQKITPKTNNLSISSALKKAPLKRGR